MKILIAADMEGISGVTCWEHVTPGHPEYSRYRRLMTADVNAAIRGAFDGGADEVVVADGHNIGGNLLLEELDPRARLNAGNTSPFSMVQGIEAGVQAVLLVGYHARAGSLNAVLDHTWSSSKIANLWLNGQVMGEIGLNAAVCGAFNAPVVLISGDQTACAEAQALLGPLETVVVKHASGRVSAECLPPAITQDQIYQAAVRAVQRACANDALQPFHVAAPVQVGVEFFNCEMADRAMLLPGAQRAEARLIRFTAPDMQSAYTGFRALVALAG